MNLYYRTVYEKYTFTVSQLRYKSYTPTVLLPKTNFPLRLENEKLLVRDSKVNETINSNDLYKWQQQNLSKPEFILHDGPPYANGVPHMGHAINKILKDVILRYKILSGQSVSYIPGWDCHGLPIELKAVKAGEQLSALEIRKKAREFADEAKASQKKIFESWGILGDWNNAYTTYSKDYITNQYKQFFKLYKNGLVFRDVKPIHWSPSTKTALAESELEYNENHKSPSAYVKLEIENFPNVKLAKGKRVSALIWTTTPWTLPSNQAICYSPNLKYCLCSKNSEDDFFIVAADLVTELENNLNANLEIVEVLPDGILKNIKYRHPIYKNQLLSFFPSGHVVAAKGTGLVHTAPAHGPDDFLVALENQISIVDLVDDNGCYKKEAGSDLEGKFVLTEGNDDVIKMLDEELVHLTEIRHSYPYDWRTKKPVIVKASAQWFLNTNHVKKKAIECVDHLTFLPTSRSKILREEFMSQIERRPFWCISRQRKWGVPIPVFYLENSKEILCDENIINHQCELLEKNGSDYWWSLSEEKLLPQNFPNPLSYKKSEDIFDIWFDSGISWSKVLNGKQADLYLEGSDQLNGWFYSSLITSLACRDSSPYKTIYVHGFAVDDKGSKMSKSIGNIVDPSDITNGKKGKKPYGVDVLRWWVACHSNQDALLHVSQNVMDSCAQEIQKIRSILRFILGALNDYDYKSRGYEELSLLDKYMLHILQEFDNKTKNDSNNYKFHWIGKSLINLAANQISALYYPAIKDKLYCEAQDSTSRRSVQFTLHQILNVVSGAVAPIVPHLVEEVHMHLPQQKSFFQRSFERAPKDWRNDALNDIMELVLDIKKSLNTQVGTGCNVMELTVTLSENIMSKIKELFPDNKINEVLVDILQCASITVTSSDGQMQDYQLDLKRTEKFLCPRCRRHQSNSNEELCCRCTKVLNDANTSKESMTA